MKDILKNFSHQNLYTSGQILFKTLGVNLQTKTTKNVGLTAFNLKQTKAIKRLINVNPEAYFLGTIDQNTFGKNSRPLFAQTDYEETLQKAQDGKYKGIIVVGVHFKNDIKLNRTDLGNLTRAFNQASASLPVILLMQYQKDKTDFLSIAASERGDYKQSWRTGEKIGKIAILKDINLQNPHTGHWRILEDMKAQHLNTFEELHLHWQEVFNIEKLNKKFYKELRNWYFWALRKVQFPTDVLKDKETRNATNTIRLITRLMFVWFLREKNLIPDWIFDKKEVDKLLDNSKKDIYYNAILQNLFFATLNRSQEERSFALDKGFHGNKNQHSIYNLYRYENLFRISADEVIEKFKTIPFLNGGLFECLDSRKKAEDSKKEQSLYIDGFTRNAKKRAIIPDEVFFGNDIEVDLSDIYGDKRRNREAVKGLFHILNSYKFTVAENTPIEQEIALDPELLGQVFENLLASFNPETQTTARKQTGSFYTPREIVDYMVDESLLAYLMQQFEDAKQSKQSSDNLKSPLDYNVDDLETKLRSLIGYENDANPFAIQSSGDSKSPLDYTSFIVEALHRCKILDPACGSGAFPMGVLLKMTHILSKLDPNNEQWKTAEINKRIAPFLEDKKQVEKIGYEAARLAAIEKLDSEIKAIETAFDDNEADYARKLYLIENCIYGIDIQPIAVQISKLRFFISLIVNQNEQPNKDNRGILPLPNLETKFVAANTLIGLDKPKQLTLRNPKIEDLENELKDIRKKHFNAQNRREKEKCRKDDKRIRNEIATLLEYDGWNTTTAKQLAAWNPYNQNTASDFFDMEWMFGINDGFDVVIGNPPYVQIQTLTKDVFKLQNQGYKTFSRTADLYCLFYENSINILKKNGISTLITSNKWMSANYGKKTRAFLSKYSNPLQLIDFNKVRLFDGATVFVNILMTQKAKNENVTKALKIKDDYTNNLIEYFNKNQVELNDLSADSWNIVSELKQKINSVIEEKGTPLLNWDVAFYRGITTGYNQAFHIDEQTKNTLIAADPKNTEIIKPLLRGKDIKRYKYEFQDWYMLFIPWHFPLHDEGITTASQRAENEFQLQYPFIYEHLLGYEDKLSSRNQTETGIRYEWYALQRYGASYNELFEKEKIVWIEISDRANYAYDDKGMYLTNSAYFLSGKNLKYLLAVLNSKVADYYFFQKTAQIAGGRKRYTKQYVEQTPIPKIPKSDYYFKQRPIEILVDFILYIREHAVALTREDKAMSSFFEQIINVAVYELYFENLLKKEKRDILQYLQDLKPIHQDLEAINYIRTVYQTFYDKNHAVRNAIFFVDTIAEIKEISKTVK